MKEDSRTERGLEEAPLSSQMETITEGLGSRISEIAEEFACLLTAQLTQGTGRKTKWKEVESCYSKMET